MKILFAFLLLVSQLSAAITVTSRGVGANSVSTTGHNCFPTSNFTSGSFAVLVVAADNAGSGGSASMYPATATDDAGNTWTRRVDAIYDPGAANAGVEVAIYSAQLAGAFTTSNTLQITFDGGVSCSAKCYVMWEVTGAGGSTISYVTSVAGTGSATGTPTITTSSVASGDVVIGVGGAESANTWTGDADTTNGSWSSQQATASGTGNSGMSITTQSKVVTATATQTYNPTLTSADCILAWAQFHETAGTTTSRGFFPFLSP